MDITIISLDIRQGFANTKQFTSTRKYFIFVFKMACTTNIDCTVMWKYIALMQFNLPARIMSAPTRVSPHEIKFVFH